jgi:hypothetical protein
MNTRRALAGLFDDALPEMRGQWTSGTSSTRPALAA